MTKETESKTEDVKEDSTPAEASAPPADEATVVIDALKAEIAEGRDRLLRLSAEMENLRRRNERDMADARQYAVSGFARDLLSIGDNLSRALEAVPVEARTEGGAMTALYSGVEMTEREFARVIEKHGLRKIAPDKEKFDPHRHQAMFEVENDSVPAGTVVQLVQPGYALNERVLRPALVGVSKAASKPEPVTSSPPIAGIETPDSSSDSEAPGDGSTGN